MPNYSGETLDKKEKDYSEEIILEICGQIFHLFWIIMLWDPNFKFLF